MTHTTDRNPTLSCWHCSVRFPVTGSRGRPRRYCTEKCKRDQARALGHIRVADRMARERAEYLSGQAQALANNYGPEAAETFLLATSRGT